VIEQLDSRKNKNIPKSEKGRGKWIRGGGYIECSWETKQFYDELEFRLCIIVDILELRINYSLYFLI